MLAYVFWHRPRAGADIAAYESAQVAFHRSLAGNPPVGMRSSSCFRVARVPWLQVADGQPASGAADYEDWYLLDDFTALGVLNEAAVGRGHRTSHDRAARAAGEGAGGVYCLVEGEPRTSWEQGAPAPATWVSRPPGSGRFAIGELLGDGMDPHEASLWRRQLVLGPAPEFCLQAPEVPAGVAAGRLPPGWGAVTLAREALFGG